MTFSDIFWWKRFVKGINEIVIFTTTQSPGKIDKKWTLQIMAANEENPKPIEADDDVSP